MSKNETHVLILATARSGSSLLFTMLGSHSNLHCEAELFNTRELNEIFPTWWTAIIRQFPLLYVQYRMHRNKQFKPCYGFKLFPGQLKNISALINQLQKRHFKVVCLRRNNIIKQAISLAIALEQDKWVIKSKNEYTNKTFTLKPEQVVEYLQFYKAQVKDLQEFAAKCNPIWVDYEADLMHAKNHPAFSKRICNELGYKEELLHSDVLPTDYRSDNERITNLNEILNYLEQHGYINEVQLYKRYNQ